MSFGGLNVRDYLLIGIRYEKDIAYNEMYRKDWLIIGVVEIVGKLNFF